MKTDISHAVADDISIRGKSLGAEILGHWDFVETLCWAAFGKLPTPQEKNMFNALLVKSLEHGLTPSIISARLTLLGAPDALQGAVAAGLLGAGSRFLGVPGIAARQLRGIVDPLGAEPTDDRIQQAAAAFVDDRLARKARIFGFGHPIHRQEDPRVVALRKLSRDNGFHGKYWKTADAIVAALRSHGSELPINAAGASGAMIAEMGIDEDFGGGLSMVARCGGILAHLMEEKARPIASEVWKTVSLADDRNSFH